MKTIENKEPIFNSGGLKRLVVMIASGVASYYVISIVSGFIYGIFRATH